MRALLGSRGAQAAVSADAAQAQDAGTRLGIEFFPWSNIKTLHDGLKLVEDAGHDTAGVVIDVWHIERAHTPVADLASVLGNTCQHGCFNYSHHWIEGCNFDGNGQYTRFQPGGGQQTLSTGNTTLGGPPMFANPNLPSLGSIPRYPARKPPYRRDVECHENALPKVNENAVRGTPGP